MCRCTMVEGCTPGQGNTRPCGVEGRPSPDAGALRGRYWGMGIMLAIISGLCWTLVYVESLRVSLRDRTYAMPVFALGLNMAWEVLYAVDGLAHWERYGAFGQVQTTVNVVWALFDVALVWAFFRFGTHAWPQLGRSLVILMGVSALVVGAVVQGVLFAEFGPRDAPVYAAFAQNLLMSVLFVDMLLRRGGPAGQSLVIAYAKLVGTLAATVSIGFLSGFDPYPAILGLLCLAFDVLYVLALHSVTPRTPAGASVSPEAS